MSRDATHYVGDDCPGGHAPGIDEDFAVAIRERIAQQIEAFHAMECGPVDGVWARVCTCVTAAAIARGES